MSTTKDIGNGQAEHIASDEEFNVTMTKELVKRTSKLQQMDIDIAIRAKEAREFLDWHCNHQKIAWFDWIKESGTVLESIRQTRVAIGIESKLLLAECADVRKFFLDEEHQKEISRLKDFIDVCERLRSLKDDGTLDKLADTILKL